MQTREQVFNNVNKLLVQYRTVTSILRKHANLLTNEPIASNYETFKEPTWKYLSPSVVEYLMLAKATRLRQKGIANNDYFMFFSSQTCMTESLIRLTAQEVFFSETSLNTRINFIMQSDRGHYNAGALFLGNQTAEIFLIESARDQSNLRHLGDNISPLFQNHPSGIAFNINFISMDPNAYVQVDFKSCPIYSLVYLGLVAKMQLTELRNIQSLPLTFSLYSQSLSSLTKIIDTNRNFAEGILVSNLISNEPAKIKVTDLVSSCTFLLEDPSLNNSSSPHKPQLKTLDFKFLRILEKANQNLRSVPLPEKFAFNIKALRSEKQAFFIAKIYEIPDELLQQELLNLFRKSPSFQNFVESSEFYVFGIDEFLESVAIFRSIIPGISLESLLSDKYDADLKIIALKYYNKYQDDARMLQFDELLNLYQSNSDKLRYELLDYTPPSSPTVESSFAHKPSLVRGGAFYGL